MSTPYTLMRCRMKDLISCFNACKVIEKDDESLDRHHKPNPSSSTSNNNIIIDNENKRDKEQMEAVTTAKGGGFESPASWQSCESEEDEYIVFYFKNDDTGGDVIEERGMESSTVRQQNVFRRKKHEKGKMQPDARSVLRELKEPEEHMEVSSDSSTSSFAFPAIQREWPGSPVLMPRPEGHRSVCIQCCKF